MSIGIVYRLDLRDLLYFGVGTSAVSKKPYHLRVTKQHGGGFIFPILSFDEKGELISGDLAGDLTAYAEGIGADTISIKLDMMTVPRITRISRQSGVFLSMSGAIGTGVDGPSYSLATYEDLLLEMNIWSFLGLISRKVAFLNTERLEADMYPTDDVSEEITKLIGIAQKRET